MIKFDWVKKCAHKGEQVAECLQFFGVSSVDAWRRRYAEPLAAFKASSKFEKNSAAVSAWLRQGERLASELACRPYDRVMFKQALAELRTLTNETDPKVFVPRMVETCARAGVAIVIEQAPKGCPISGATRWLSPDKALLMLSLRHKTNDHLWFAFFHEAGHILLHGKKMMFLETNGLDDEHEREADKFARDLLIPPDQAMKLEFIDRTYAGVTRFANELGIAPAIVVGRMQKEGYLPWNMLNKCKVRYQWKPSIDK